MSRNNEKRMIDIFIAIFNEKTYQNLPNIPLLHPKARMYINRAIIIKFVYPSREPATRIGQ